MKYLPPLKCLQFFCVAGQLQSFKKAAEKLNVTQAAVSQQIRLLEDHLGLQLFERSARQTRLTEAGRRMLPFIESGFEELTNGVMSVTGDPRPDVLRISTLHSFTSLWLIPRLQEFQSKYPDIMVQLAPINELVDFKQSDIDLAIRMGRGGYSGLQEKKLLNEYLSLVASPSLLKGIDVKDPKQVFRLPWIDDTSRGIQEVLLACCKQFEIDRKTLVPVMESNNAVPLIESAVAGRGFMLANSSLVADHLRTGRLVNLLNYKSKSPYSLFLVAPESHFKWHKVQMFEQWFVPKVKASFADLDNW